MGKIRVLPAEVVNKIAAGEVIERPASLVKELVENSLDAGAASIRIEIEEGGRKLVRVTDDGHGIAPEDLPLAFEPHATSKLATADDLFHVGTFGFRGEALASIGAVSRTRIAGRVKGAVEGAEIVMENGSLGPARPAGAAEGTIVEVRNLFQNVPVRRKFLRSPQVEYDHVHDVLSRFAIACPSVRFDFTADGERRMTLPPADRRARIGQFFGDDVREALIEVEHAGRPTAFTALLAPPRFARLSLKAQYVYLNGRFIKDRVLSHAINESYRETLPHGRYPVAFLFLDVDPGEVDVNVHPTKIEVRFRQVWRVHDLVVEELRAKLLAGELAPELQAAALAPKPAPPTQPYQEIVDFFVGKNEPPAVAEIPAAPPLLTTGRRYFQVHDRYILEEADDGIRIYDQHALHERYLLEKFRKQYASADIARQRLLLPAVVDLGDPDRALLEEHRALLESLGIEFEDFGRKSVAVRAVPAILRDDDPSTILRDFLEKVREHGESEREAGHPLPLLDEALHFLACRAAVKFGRRLAAEELEQLLADAEGMDFSATCAHGRPTSIKLTLDELERYFKRK